MTRSNSERKYDQPIKKWSRKAKILEYLERLESHANFPRFADIVHIINCKPVI